MAIPALTSQQIEASLLISTSDSAYRLLSLDLTWTHMDIPNLIDGGLLVGVSHSDYTDAEILEWIEASTSISRGDKIANERANRLIRLVGMFPSLDGGAAEGDIALNGGRPIKIKLNWPIEIGKQVKAWFLNSSPTTISTGSDLSCVGKANIVYT